jgi:hypothetical protein
MIGAGLRIVESGVLERLPFWSGDTNDISAMVRAFYLSRFKASVHLSCSHRSKSAQLPLQMPSFDLLLSCFRPLHHQQQKKPYSPVEISKSSYTQPQSSFFTKLPLEIRHIIYLFSVPPCKNVNIFYNSLTAERAPWPSDSAEYAEMHTNTWHYPVYYRCQHRWKRQGNLTKLFLVCRKM